MSTNARPNTLRDDISSSDQRRPCSLTNPDDGHCTRRAQFRLYPTCADNEQQWPYTQSCTPHLAAVVRLASARCTGHMGGRVVRVVPL